MKPTTNALETAALAAAATAALAACGGGGEDASSTTSADGKARASGLLPTAGALTDIDAWRFLNQATMGPNKAEIAFVKTKGIEAWLSQQFAYTAPLLSHATFYKNKATNKGTTPWVSENHDWLFTSWWDQAVRGADQLRQRVSLALSEILVISSRDETLGARPYAVAAYMDTLAKHALGNFRQLIEDVCKHPAMGIYLTHFANQPPAANGTYYPDQNFARELLQLFTLSLTKLAPDGSVAINDEGVLSDSSGRADIVTLSNVFTGWALDNDPALNLSNDGAGKTDTVNYFGHLTDSLHSSRFLRPMKAFKANHSNGAKAALQLGKDVSQLSLLGQPFVFDESANAPQVNLTRALDIIFAHPNLAPFVSKQLIQRLVTSNPAPAYVQRVATAFKAGNWSMKALIRAILLDAEATNSSKAISTPTFGKLREPLLRFTHALRAFTATYPANPNDVKYYNTEFLSSGNSQLNLNQSPFRAISVFNFFLPTYRMSGGQMAAQGKVAPEFQLASEAAVTAYVNAAYYLVRDGFGANQFIKLNLSDEIAAAASGPAAVVASVNARLFGGALSNDLKNYLIATITPASGQSTTPTIQARTAVFLSLVSSEYLVQK